MTTKANDYLIDFLTREIGMVEKNVALWNRNANDIGATETQRQMYCLEAAKCNGMLSAYRAALKEAQHAKAMGE